MSFSEQSSEVAQAANTQFPVLFIQAKQIHNFFIPMKVRPPVVLAHSLLDLSNRSLDTDLRLVCIRHVEAQQHVLELGVPSPSQIYLEEDFRLLVGPETVEETTGGAPDSGSPERVRYSCVKSYVA